MFKIVPLVIAALLTNNIAVLHTTTRQTKQQVRSTSRLSIRSNLTRRRQVSDVLWLGQGLSNLFRGLQSPQFNQRGTCECCGLGDQSCGLTLTFSANNWCFLLLFGCNDDRISVRSSGFNIEELTSALFWDLMNADLRYISQPTFRANILNKDIPFSTTNLARSASWLATCFCSMARVNSSLNDRCVIDTSSNTMLYIFDFSVNCSRISRLTTSRCVINSPASYWACNKRLSYGNWAKQIRCRSTYHHGLQDLIA